MNPISDLAYQINQLTLFSSYNITHIGANNGEDLNDLRKLLSPKHLGTKYIGYEANPYWIDKVFAKNINIINKAIGNREGIFNFNLVKTQNRNSSTFMTRTDEWGIMLEYNSIQCEMIRGIDIEPPTVLIIDAEGMTYEILESFGYNISKINVIMVECEHKELFAGQKLFSEVNTLLISQGFIMTYFAFEYKNQSNSIFIRNTILIS